MRNAMHFSFLELKVLFTFNCTINKTKGFILESLIKKCIAFLN